MNKNQKNLLLALVVAMLLSVLFVPEEENFNNIAFFSGFAFIGNLTDQISLKVILIEWVAIIVIFFALYKYFED